MPAKFIPDGYHSVTPYLTLRGADKVIAFLKKAFNAETIYEPLPVSRIRETDSLRAHATKSGGCR